MDGITCGSLSLAPEQEYLWHTNRTRRRPMDRSPRKF